MTAEHDLLRLSAGIVAAHVAYNKVEVGDLPALIRSVYSALGRAGEPQAKVEVREPAVPIKKSVFPGYIVCLEDGKKLKMLKRHLQSSFGLTPDQYRSKWGLPDSYPMTAPDYAKHRSALARSIGLGLKTAEEPTSVEIPVTKIPAARRGKGSKKRATAVSEEAS